jgi:hypothetical protein
MDNEQRIEDLKNALREIMQMVADRDQPLGPELKTILAQVIEHVATRIQELRQQGAKPIKPTDLEPGPFPSSNINAFRFDPKSGDLIVKFQDKYPGQNGPIYKYNNVPPFIFDVFRRGAVVPKTSGKNAWHRWKKGVAPSLGASMAALVKNGGYNYQRIG